MERFYDWAQIHWPIFLFAFVLSVIGQYAKNAVWTEERATAKGRWRWFFLLMWKTLPLHPIATAAIVGVRLPTPAGWAGWVGHAVYWSASGAVALVLYAVLKRLGKKAGISLPEIGKPSEPPKT